jgi:hypothetical protein
MVVVLLLESTVVGVFVFVADTSDSGGQFGCTSLEVELE